MNWEFGITPHSSSSDAAAPISSISPFASPSSRWQASPDVLRVRRGCVPSFRSGRRRVSYKRQLSVSQSIKLKEGARAHLSHLVLFDQRRLLGSDDSSTALWTGGFCGCSRCLWFFDCALCHVCFAFWKVTCLPDKKKEKQFFVLKSPSQDGGSLSRGYTVIFFFDGCYLTSQVGWLIGWS